MNRTHSLVMEKNDAWLYKFSFCRSFPGFVTRHFVYSYKFESHQYLQNYDVFREKSLKTFILRCTANWSKFTWDELVQVLSIHGNPSAYVSTLYWAEFLGQPGWFLWAACGMRSPLIRNNQSTCEILKFVVSSIISIQRFF